MVLSFKKTLNSELFEACTCDHYKHLNSELFEVCTCAQKAKHNSFKTSNDRSFQASGIIKCCRHNFGVSTKHMERIQKAKRVLWE